jgi:3-deoxy-7-phosphoheptulonate synthase
MAVVLQYGASLPVIKMGRMAGQYAKPRSNEFETIDGQTLPVYRGDAVNSHEFTPQARRPDPSRFVEAYHRSAATLNLARAFTTGGFADLRRVHEWNRGFLANTAYARYNAIADEIDRAIRFMDACGVDFDALKTVDFYSSHEALLLDYERASPGSTPAPVTPMTVPGTSSGLGNGPGKLTEPMSTSSPG